ncbi:hypothetical protein LOAG_01558 [Loa loa]|uniref:Arrestin-like N-terminal domain-containing protein n=1 Tax=Loa loa TaxID=7209 RepID=A0A1S0U946_LOALO|nr:hypothetical protein LOAG_01558 [Loa loa]EFO26933.1 hypothetical protein LOAG_01558 [Loa loa]
MTSSSLAVPSVTGPFSVENLPYHVDILLSEKIYNPGDMIHGEVIFRLSNNLSYHLINVQLFGIIRVFWIDKKAVLKLNMQIGNGCFCLMAREQKRVLLDETIVLWSEEKTNHKKPIPSYVKLSVCRTGLPFIHKDHLPGPSGLGR